MSRISNSWQNPLELIIAVIEACSDSDLVGIDWRDHICLLDQCAFLIENRPELDQIRQARELWMTQCLQFEANNNPLVIQELAKKDRIIAKLLEVPLPGHLGLIVYDQKGVIEREGHRYLSGKPKQVTFDRSSAEWHAFLTAWNAAPEAATVNQWKLNYPQTAQWENHRKHKSAAGSKLRTLSVGFDAGELRLIEKN